MDVSVPSAVMLPTGGMGFFGLARHCRHREGKYFIQQFQNWNAERARTADAIGIGSCGEAVVADRTSHQRQRRALLQTVPPTPARNTSTSTAAWPGRCWSTIQCRADHLRRIVGPRVPHAAREARQRRVDEGSRRGRTSHDRFPGLILGQRPDGCGRRRRRQRCLWPASRLERQSYDGRGQAG